MVFAFERQQSQVETRARRGNAVRDPCLCIGYGSRLLRSAQALSLTTRSRPGCAGLWLNGEAHAVSTSGKASGFWVPHGAHHAIHVPAVSLQTHWMADSGTTAFERYLVLGVLERSRRTGDDVHRCISRKHEAPTLLSRCWQVVVLKALLTVVSPDSSHLYLSDRRITCDCQMAASSGDLLLWVTNLGCGELRWHHVRHAYGQILSTGPSLAASVMRDNNGEHAPDGVCATSSSVATTPAPQRFTRSLALRTPARVV
jgi:hypothetical protein